MTGLAALVDEQCASGATPGVVAVLARGDDVEVATGGEATIGGAPMRRDSLFRLASLTKPILAAATMVLVERGRFDLDEPVRRWLPELAEPMVLRSLDGPLDDTVPAVRPITIRHLLTFQAGHGFPSDFSAPIVARLTEELHQGPPNPAAVPPPDEWMRRLAETPLLHQPGDGWTYNTGADILGVLLARVEETSLDVVLSDTVLGPLGMTDSGFAVPAGELHRMTSLYRRDGDGAVLTLIDPPDGQWAETPVFLSGAAGLVSTADDLLAFGRMLLAGGRHGNGRVLSAESVRLMTTSHVESAADDPFLQGQGWGFGGSVDLHPSEPWNVPGRYGWIGGTGTAGYVIPATGTVAIRLSQLEMSGPTDFDAIGAFLTLAAQR